MESQDIITACKEHPRNIGAAVTWRGKVESYSVDEVILHIKRKILAEDHLDYLVRIKGYQGKPLEVGTKMQVSGTIPDHLEIVQQDKTMQYMLELTSAVLEAISEADYATSRTPTEANPQG